MLLQFTSAVLVALIVLGTCGMRVWVLPVERLGSGASSALAVVPDCRLEVAEGQGAEQCL